MLNTLNTRLFAPMAVAIPAESDRRAHQRLVCRLLVHCRDGAGLQWRCRAIDLSRLGVCLVFWSAMAPPDVAILGFRGYQSKDIVLRARVVHLRRQGNFWMVGCAFEHRLIDEEFAGLI